MKNLYISYFNVIKMYHLVKKKRNLPYYNKKKERKKSKVVATNSNFPMMIILSNSSGFAELQGADEGSQATLVSTIGITNTLGRIICGWISDHPKVGDF